MKLCGKDYVVPELTFEHAEMLERESGVGLYDIVFGKYTTLAARIFVQIVTGLEADDAKKVLNEHIKTGGYKALGVIVDEFVEAVFDSDFFCALLGLPTKAEREKLAQEAAKQAQEAAASET